MAEKKMRRVGWAVMGKFGLDIYSVDATKKETIERFNHENRSGLVVPNTFKENKKSENLRLIPLYADRKDIEGLKAENAELKERLAVSIQEGNACPYCEVLKEVSKENERLVKLLERAGEWITVMTDEANRTPLFDQLLSDITETLKKLKGGGELTNPDE